MSETLPGITGIRNSKGSVLRRLWTTKQKRQIVEESFLPGMSVSIVARRHDVNTNQVFKWRQLYKRGELGGEAKAPAGFVPVGVIEHDGVLAMEKEKPVPVTSPASLSAPTQGIIELVLHQGIRVRMKGNVELPVLRCVLQITLGMS